MSKGRKPLVDGYVINLEDVACNIAHKEHPRDGTEVDVIIPVCFNGDDFNERCAFLLDGKIFQSSYEGSLATLSFSTMRRRFRFYDQFPGKENRTNYKRAQTYDSVGLEYYYRVYNKTG